MRRILFSAVVFCLSLQAIAVSKVSTKTDSNGNFSAAEIVISGAEGQKLWTYLNNVAPGSMSIFTMSHKEEDTIVTKGIKCSRNLIGKTEDDKSAYNYNCRIVLNKAGSVVMDATREIQPSRSIIRTN